MLRSETLSEETASCPPTFMILNYNSLSALSSLLSIFDIILSHQSDFCCPSRARSGSHFLPAYQVDI